jgi:bacterioferritin-associated ferredoxin
LLGFEKSYEVCNCKKITIAHIENVIKNQNATTLREIQDLTTAGTECRHCIFPEGDFGKMKKKIYCKDILNEFRKGLTHG